MIKRLNRAGVLSVVEIILLLGVGVVATIFLGNWTNSNFENYLFENELEGNVGELEILGIKSSGEYGSILGIRNTGSINHNISVVKIGDTECRVLNSKNVGNIKNLELNCNVDKLSTYNIDIISDKGIYSKVATVWEEHVEDVSLNIPFQASFDFGSTCVNSTRAYGMSYTNNSHAEISSSNNFTYSACLSHDDYTLGTSCSGNFVKLFTLAGITNSPIYIDNSNVVSEPYVGYYNWQDVCVSSSGGVMDLIYSEIRPENRNYICVGSFVQDDFMGGVIGGCSAYDTKIWLDIN